MLFNSYEFILFFLPICAIAYFLLNHYRLALAAKIWLILGSLFFYSWWNIKYLPLIVGSIMFNFTIGLMLAKDINTKFTFFSRRLLLIFGIGGNLTLLAYFKYTNFLIDNINTIFESNIYAQDIILPLGISFFTFTQIAFLVDAYKFKVKELSYLNYSLFVTFFPHLLAGPILHHKEMMPQFDTLRNKIPNYKNISMGLFLFSIGIFKKLMIADTFSEWANAGFSATQNLSMIEAWITSLSYTIQIYFDFSGYTDMALGIALIFNIKLPVNFNSPYKALNIQDFWRRWHITLSRFLRDYIYIPLGGNQVGPLKVYSNIFTVFLLGGLWHGASWMFIIWGLLHGFGMIIHRIWVNFGLSMNRWIAWVATFSFINFTWIFFRATNFDQATNIIKGMLGLQGIIIPPSLSYKFGYLKHYGINFAEWSIIIGNKYMIILFVLLIILFTGYFKNSNYYAEHFKPNLIYLGISMFCLIVSFLSLEKTSQFLYFNF